MLDRDLVSFHAHADHPIACPFSDATVEAIVAALPPARGVLDVGCGRGAWLLRILSRHGDARGEGIDHHGPLIEAAAATARQLGIDPRVRFTCGDAAEALDAAGTFELVLCLGATHALGGLATALPRLAARLAPGGRLLVGEGFWERAPTPAALASLGARRGDLPDGVLGFAALVLERPAPWTRPARPRIAAAPRPETSRPRSRPPCARPRNSRRFFGERTQAILDQADASPRGRRRGREPPAARA